MKSSEFRTGGPDQESFVYIPWQPVTGNPGKATFQLTIKCKHSSLEYLVWSSGPKRGAERSPLGDQGGTERVGRGGSQAGEAKIDRSKRKTTSPLGGQTLLSSFWWRSTKGHRPGQPGQQVWPTPKPGLEHYPVNWLSPAKALACSQLVE